MATSYVVYLEGLTGPSTTPPRDHNVILPIRTDAQLHRTPHVNHALIAINVLVYIAFDMIGEAMGWNAGGVAKDPLMLWSGSERIYQFITYQFLHGDIWHLVGNMLFLWVFGNAVNAKMGNLAYLLFYIAGGIAAAIGFTLANPGVNLLGASGSIAAVTTAFLVLFPRSTITVIVWYFVIGRWHVRALLFIAGKIILWDNVLAPSIASGSSSVAYSAHIVGYLFGFISCAVLLAIRALPRDQYDILALIKRYHQRQQFCSAMSDPVARARATYGRVAQTPPMAKPVGPTARPVQAQPVEVYDEITRLRMEIANLLSKRAYTEAADLYQELVMKDPGQVLPSRNMLDVANQLMTLQRYPQAAAAYEKYLHAYPHDSEITQVRLLLGIIYAKYLQQYASAKRYLQACLPHLTQPDQIRQANHWLEESISATGGPWTA